MLAVRNSALCSVNFSFFPCFLNRKLTSRNLGEKNNWPLTGNLNHQLQHRRKCFTNLKRKEKLKKNYIDAEKCSKSKLISYSNLLKKPGAEQPGEEWRLPMATGVSHRPDAPRCRTGVEKGEEWTGRGLSGAPQGVTEGVLGAEAPACFRGEKRSGAQEGNSGTSNSEYVVY